MENLENIEASHAFYLSLAFAEWTVRTEEEIIG